MLSQTPELRDQACAVPFAGTHRRPGEAEPLALDSWLGKFADKKKNVLVKQWLFLRGLFFQTALRSQNQCFSPQKVPLWSRSRQTMASKTNQAQPVFVNLASSHSHAHSVGYCQWLLRSCHCRGEPRATVRHPSLRSSPTEPFLKPLP